MEREGKKDREILGDERLRRRRCDRSSLPKSEVPVGTEVWSA
jgi:hypothetical protein